MNHYMHTEIKQARDVCVKLIKFIVFPKSPEDAGVIPVAGKASAVLSALSWGSASPSNTLQVISTLPTSFIYIHSIQLYLYNS